jgi:uncharacterized protein YndB with AHSA1/START domain
MVTPSAKVAPINRSVTVNRKPMDAFRIFTEKIGSWWPTIGHSIGDERVVDIVFEPAEGGRVYEVWDDGTQHDWARLLAWEPGSRLVMAWQPNPDRPAPTAVEIRFIHEGEGTRVELEHREWDRLGDEAEEARANYAGGWQTTLNLFAQAAS